jgi:phage terminase small subunit
MRQRGRKSAAALSVGLMAPAAQVRPLPPGHQPPAWLSPDAANIWRSTASAKSAEWLEYGATYQLLEIYCGVVAQSNFVAKLLEATSLEHDSIRFAKLQKMACDLTVVLTLFATKLQLTPQSQMSARTARRELEGARPSARKMWDVFLK